MLPPKPRKRKLPQLILAMVIGFLLVLGGGLIKQVALGQQTVVSQYLRPEFVADQIYTKLNYLPKENQYLNKETGKPVPENTLLNRFIRYHQDIVKRPTRFRLDWQLTLADYLGVNQEIKEERYPGRSTLTVNPMEADIKIIQSLNRRQREELVEVLVSIYDVDPEKPSTPEQSPNSPSNPTQTTPQATPTPTPTTPKKPSLSKPGDANLLVP
ncbi:hypothetical protein [Gloeothece verrucosa]|uniref:Uncharacterized protein n=1 Tax=Gloeothece verrucosa (strain PCC 7822) TaxID=497965 RepID=E0UBS3_GLOV7|nr:hypothetical protein [Gloeothece verrucosa]ADN15138.1 conserved hypothetical protein [Gloeothece verrucosa PCC 7822]